MKPQTIYYISNQANLNEKLNQISRNDEFVLQPYDIKEKAFVENLIFFEPYQVKGNNYEIHRLWKNYFKKASHQKIKIIVVGLGNFSSEPNYINLLNFPKNLTTTMKNSLSLEDSWSLPKKNENIVYHLSVFFEGHSHKSLLDRIVYFQMYMSNIDDIVHGRKKNQNFEYVEKELLEPTKLEWEKFIKRWNDYLHFFDCCPFIKKVEGIKENIKNIEYFLNAENPSPELFISNDCFQHSIEIQDQLEYIKSYINDPQPSYSIA